MLSVSRADSRIIDELLSSFGREVKLAKGGNVTTGDSGLSILLQEAGLVRAWLLTRIVAAALVGLLLALLVSPLAGVTLAAPGVVGTWLVVTNRAHKRRDELDRDLPTLLTSVASSVRAGLDPLVAVARARDYFPVGSVMREELERFHNELSSGRSEEDVIEGFCKTVRHPDMPLFKGCLSLSRRHGSSLADPLHRVTRVIRQRQSFRRKTRAALAMHRMSAIGIVLCALLICGIQAAMNLDGIRLAAVHPIGSKVLAAGIFCILAGVTWMMSLGTESGA